MLIDQDIKPETEDDWYAIIMSLFIENQKFENISSFIGNISKNVYDKLRCSLRRIARALLVAEYTAAELQSNVISEDILEQSRLDIGQRL